MRPFFVIIVLSIIFLSCGGRTFPAHWNSIADFPGVGRQNAVSFNNRNSAFVGLGDNGDSTFNDFWKFDYYENTWSRKADFPGNVREPIFFSYYDNGYIMSGHCGCKDFWSYNYGTDKWTKKADCPVSDLYHAAVFTVDQYAYICSGLQNGSLQNNMWRYDLVNDKWDQLRDYPGTPVELAVGFSFDGRGIVTTGNKAGGKSKELWQYDPNTDLWTRKADFPYEVSGCVAFGGLYYNGYVGLGDLGAEFYQYNYHDNNWSKTPDFPGGSRKRAVVIELGDHRVVGLGTSNAGQFTKDMWEFIPEWTAK